MIHGFDNGLQGPLQGNEISEIFYLVLKLFSPHNDFDPEVVTVQGFHPAMIMPQTVGARKIRTDNHFKHLQPRPDIDPLYAGEGLS